jgi:membrane protease subunit (stomatin/prohibitin family)
MDFSRGTEKPDDFKTSVIQRLTAEMDRVFYELGVKLYVQIKTGAINLDGVSWELSRIEELDREIECVRDGGVEALAVMNGIGNLLETRAETRPHEQNAPAQHGICGSCGAGLKPEIAFCTLCGKPVRPSPAELRCSSCGEALDGDSAFCTTCGARCL